MNLHSDSESPTGTISTMPMSRSATVEALAYLHFLLVIFLNEEYYERITVSSPWSGEPCPTNSTQGPRIVRKTNNLIGKKSEEIKANFLIREDPRSIQSSSE